jgi:hypothetical protein
MGSVGVLEVEAGVGVDGGSGPKWWIMVVDSRVTCRAG